MRNKHQKTSQLEVLAWLQQNHPALHACAEVERDWIWLAIDLRGDHNKPTREAIKEYGFIFQRKGGHLLASGKLGMWGHSCERPMRFGKKASSQSNGTTKTTTQELNEDTILAMFGVL